MRILPLFALAMLAACGRSDLPAEGAEVSSGIECRLDGAEGFEPVCTAASRETDRGLETIVRRPDGGFRRLLRTNGGVEAADGAEPARVTRLDDNRLEVEIGGDSYRLPARGTE